MDQSADQPTNQQIMAELLFIKSRLAELMNNQQTTKQELENDLPTEITDGIQYWKNDKGQIHRDGDLPAIIYPSGTKHWCQNGCLHRDALGHDGNVKPAIEYSTGGKKWYRHDQLHRENDLPAVECPDGYTFWFYEGKKHRSGDKPATIRPNGEHEWWEHGIRIKKLVFVFFK